MVKTREIVLFPYQLIMILFSPSSGKNTRSSPHFSPPKMQPNMRKGDLVMQMLSPRPLPYAQAAPSRLQTYHKSVRKFVICMFGRSVFHCAFRQH